MEDRILIVDDEELLCRLLAQRLKGEGYSCVTANNGREALSHFYKDTFSLIISDIKMPEMDGIELLKRVRDLNPKMMVIMVTAYPEIDMAVEAMRLVPPGDAVVDIEGFPYKVAAISSIVNVFVVNVLVCGIVRRLVQAGVQPPVWVSANAPGGDAWNKKLLEQYLPRIRHL